ncbi:hypothetical protein GGS21DRAFT_490470 [Xylaria nigripes]|nr:hypothetical protein GGS21DRAFT_490470 [Xylaria nigripes]
MRDQQPYMYDSDRRDSRSPEKPFDPKAVTRASWEVKPKKPKKDGPLVSFNRHPDAHVVLTGRTFNFRPMSETTKWWIKWTRYMQIVLRALELILSAGLLALTVLITEIPPLTNWILRISSAVIVGCCAYAILHLVRPARARPPASSAAYQLFAGITDLAVLPFYAFGATAALKDSGSWVTILSDATLLPMLIKTEYCGLLTAIGLHVVSIGLSIYLGLMFKRIVNMPPDMNPLESNLTSRRTHKRNKSSVASEYTYMSESPKRFSTAYEGSRPSSTAYDDFSRPPSIPFMATRASSRDSASKRDSRVKPPSHQYQTTPTSSPRSNACFTNDKKRSSNVGSAQGGSYTEVPRHEISTPSSSQPGSPAVNSQLTNDSPRRVAKFTEAWYASDSLINRTQKRQSAMNASERVAAQRSKAYEALNQRCDDSDSDQENAMQPDDVSDFENEDSLLRPDPLCIKSRPPKSSPGTARGIQQPKMRNSEPIRGQDIADANADPTLGRRLTMLEALKGGVKGTRNVSIQRDDEFYSKPYGELRSATPPIMYGGNHLEPKYKAGRQVSSGNDYDLGNAANLGYRRKVSGRAAEEGMAGPSTRYDVLDD